MLRALWKNKENSKKNSKNVQKKDRHKKAKFTSKLRKKIRLKSFNKCIKKQKIIDAQKIKSKIKIEI